MFHMNSDKEEEQELLFIIEISRVQAYHESPESWDSYFRN